MRCLIFLVSFFSVCAFAQCEKQTHAPVNVDNYYSSVSENSPIGLRNSLNRIIRGHTSYSYTPCVWEILREADEDPSNDRNVVGFYTRRSIPKSDRDSGQNDPDSWNREHIWAKSHGFPRRSQDAYTDAHHLVAADRSVNSDRSDNDFEEGGAPDDECTGCFEGSGTWEPPDEVKGNVARMMFYMDIRYEGNDGSGTPDLQLVDLASTERSNTFGQFGKLCTLLDWHIQDPVDARERSRNNVIHSWQGNRNPFIDRPRYAMQIWGEQCGLSGEISSLNETPNGTVAAAEDNPEASILEASARIAQIETEIETIREMLEDLSN